MALFFFSRIKILLYNETYKEAFMSEELTTNGLDPRTVVLVAAGVIVGIVVLNVSRNALFAIKTKTRKN